MGLIDWYVHKYWGEDYYHKDELQALCKAARTDEADKRDKMWKEYMERERIALERALHLKLTSAEDKVRRADEEVMEYKRRVKEADDKYFKAVTGAQGNLQVASAIATKVSELSNMLTSLSGSLRGVEDDAKDQLKALKGPE